MQIIMDTAQIVFMKDITFQTNMRNHVLKNVNDLVLSGSNCLSERE
jgi:hypothetical protein